MSFHNGARSRASFIYSIGGVASLGLLAGCGGSRTLPSSATSSAGSGGDSSNALRLQTMMRAMGLAAITENGVTTVRSDLLANSELFSHLQQTGVPGATLRTMITQPVAGGGGGTTGGGTPTPTPAPSDCTNVPVGGQCNGLTVIASVTATVSDSNLLNSYSYGYDTFAGSASISGMPYFGPRYTFQRLNECFAQTISSFKSDMTKLAEAVVGGAAGAYLTPANISAIIGSARAFLTGTISALAFWDVLVAVVSAVALSDLLVGIGVTLGIAVSFEVGRCLAA